jgi:serine/threonine protein kinase
MTLVSDAQYSYVGPPDAPDRYELIDRRATGGEGEVWQAREHHGGVPFSYAVKILRVPAEDQTDRGLEGLRLQAALATQLEHPALVKVKDVFVGPPPHLAGQAAPEAGSRLYFVMKWIEGRSLQEALERGEVRGLDVLAPLEPIAEAIDYLHSGRDTNGVPVLHRDIKPANVLVSGDGRVYLVDFGLVRLHSTSSTGRVFGTAPFMAPESLARGEYTPATDRYALGATVYFALTGEMPVPGDTDGMVQRLTAVLSPAQDRVIRGVLSMVALAAEARPASAAAWVRALRGAPMETSIGGSPPPTPMPAGYPLPPTSAPPVSGPPTSGAPGYPLPPTSGAPTSGAPGYPLPPSSGPPGYPLPPSSGPPGYPLPPSSGPPGYPLPPTSGPPGYPLPPSSGPPGYPGGPRPPKKKSKTGLIIGLVSALLVVACCATGVWSLSKGDPSRTGPDPAPSVDRASPPPVVTALEPVLISVADIMSAMKPEARNYVTPSSSNQALRGGLTKLELCSDPAVRGDAIGAQSSNGYSVSVDGYPSVGSAVAGFYGTAAKPFFDATRRAAERCSWQPFTVPKLGQESFGIFATESSQVYAIVFAYSGQVLIQVAIKATDGRGSYQSDVVKLATLMAKRLPKTPVKQ